MAGAFEVTAFDSGAFDAPSTNPAFDGTAFNDAAFYATTTAAAPATTTGPSGGGARRDSSIWNDTGARRGSAKLSRSVTEDEIREAYNQAMGIVPTASQPKPVPKAVKAAVRRHALEDALVPNVLPPADAIDWQAVMADSAALAAFQALIARIARDEEDAIITLLLAA